MAAKRVVLSPRGSRKWKPHNDMQFYSLRVREGGGGFSSSFLPSAPAMLLLCKALSGSLLFIHQLFLLWLTFVMCPVICLTFLEDAVSTNRLVLMSQLGRFMHANTLIKGLHFSSYNSWLSNVSEVSQQCLRSVSAVSNDILVSQESVDFSYF